MKQPVSRLRRLSAPVVVLGALFVITIGTAVATRVSSPVIPEDPTARVLVSAELLFSDRADGGVDVTNAATGRVLETLPPESNNFVRATMRGLVRQRVREGLGPQTPFRLTALSDGGLVLEDPATQRKVELSAFGATNAEAFARILSLQVAPK